MTATDPLEQLHVLAVDAEQASLIASHIAGLLAQVGMTPGDCRALHVTAVGGDVEFTVEHVVPGYGLTTRTWRIPPLDGSPERPSRAAEALAALGAERNTWARQMADLRDEAQAELDAAAAVLERLADELDDADSDPWGLVGSCRTAAQRARSWNRSQS